jgi:hypothetical protein
MPTPRSGVAAFRLAACRTRAFAVTALTLLACTVARAEVVLMPGPVSVERAVCWDTAARREVSCPDTVRFEHEGATPVRRAFRDRDFAALDALFERWCTGRDRFEDGRWKLSFFGDGIGGLFGSTIPWTEAHDIIQEWRKRHPRSTAAPYIEGIYWRSYAWEARGDGYASQVPKSAWPIFRERLARSRKVIEAMDLTSAKCPAAFPLTINVLRDSGAPRTLVRAVYDAGVSRFPEYHPIHLAMAISLDPRWGGSFAEYDAFAREVAQATSAWEGRAMYARIYWIVDDFSDSSAGGSVARGPKWPALKAAYDDLLSRYPNSLHNLARYAAVACTAGDAEAYQRLRPRLAGQESTLSNYVPYEVCDQQFVKAPRAEQAGTHGFADLPRGPAFDARPFR